MNNPLSQSPDPVLRQHVQWFIEYDVHLGKMWGKFMNGLRDCTVYGNTCSSCHRTFVPPQAFCEICVEPVDGWVVMAQEGELVTYTVVEQGFRGGPTPPYAVGAVRLDGSDTMLLHFLGGITLDDPTRVRDQLPDGRRVRIEWAEQRSGSILDISHFVPAIVN